MLYEVITDQLIEVLQALTPFLLGEVVLAQAAFLDQMLDDLGQRQIFGFAAQGLDQPDEIADRRAGLAGKAGGGVVEAGIGAMRGLL